MNRFTVLTAALLATACGGGEPAAEASSEAETAAPATSAAPASSEMAMTDWFHVDEAGESVHMTITAGATDAKNYWNFNGAADGSMTITVPEGFTVMIDFVNADPNMAHSLGIGAATGGFGAMLAPEPVFAGAMTGNPTSMMEATMPGEQERIMFTASAAGEYAMVCYIPGHAATGMWIYFNVSSDGSFGVQGAM
jgi:sulfocyanin